MEDVKLTEKQKRFCDYYIETGNATEAAVKAGYSERTAKVIGAENLTKPYLRSYIDNKMKEKDNERIASQDEILEYLTRVIRNEEQEPCVVQEQRPVIGEDGKKKGYITENKIMLMPISVKDRTRAAELLGKRYGLDVSDFRQYLELERLKQNERKVVIAERQQQEFDDDIEYIVEDTENEEEN